MKIGILLLTGLLLSGTMYAQDNNTEETRRRTLFGRNTEKIEKEVAGKQANSEKDLSKYLAKDAVPLVDGRVVFSETFTTKKTKDEAISILSEWLPKYFKPAKETIATEATDPQVLRIDSVNGTITCMGDEYMVFTRSFLVLNQTRIHYFLNISLADQSCTLTMSRIMYDYNVDEAAKTFTRIPAEIEITDQYALRKKGTKLVRETGTKFRVHTIDLKDHLFNSIQRVLQ